MNNKMFPYFPHFCPDIIAIIAHQNRDHTVVWIVFREKAYAGITTLKICEISAGGIVNDPQTRCIKMAENAVNWRFVIIGL